MGSPCGIDPKMSADPPLIKCQGLGSMVKMGLYFNCRRL